MTSYRGIVIILFLSILMLRTYASDTINSDSVFRTDEKHMSELVSQLIDIRFDDARLDKLSKQITEEFDIILNKEGSFNYPFDSIFPMGKIVSEDKLVRIFTWFAIRADGTHIHFGYIQHHNTKMDKIQLYPLIDKSDTIPENIENLSFDNNNWLGATYYDIIESESSFYGKTYTLLGWDGNNIYTKKKIIETLMFVNDDKPKFGVALFPINNTKHKRLIYEYSRMASMMLKYDTQQHMIVMDHLAPTKSLYNDNPQFYGPDLSVDALKFENELWIYFPSIDYKPNTKKNKKRFNKNRR